MSATWGVVVGAGPGLGRALALSIARQGHSVALLGRSAPRLADVAEEVRTVGGGTEVASVEVDAGDPGAVAAAVADVAGRGAIAVLAYNAAAVGGPLLAAGPDELTASLAVNAVSVVEAVRAAAQSLESVAGTVLITGGALSLAPAAPAGVLSVGKAAGRAVALVLAQELAPRGVTVRLLTIAGGIGQAPDFAPERIAEAFWRTVSGPDVETVYRGSAGAG